MKILIVHNSYQHAGGEDTVFAQEAELLASAGHDVSTLHRSNDELRLNGIASRVSAFAGSVWSSNTYQTVRQLLRQERFDIAHVHNTHLVISPSVLWACHSARVPVVQTLHNYRLFCASSNLYRDGKVCEECIAHGPHRAMRHACFQGSRARTAGVVTNIALHRALGTWEDAVHTYIALTSFSRQKFIQAGIPEERITIKPNFVSPDPGYVEQRGDYLIFVGRLTPEKGVHTLVSAMQELPRTIPLLIVGDGPARVLLQQQIAASGLNNVEMLGQQTRAQTLRLLKGARFLVFPSEWYETFGLSIVEAMACGTPVIASRLGGISDTIQDGITGQFFTPGDYKSLAETIRNSWPNTELARRLAKNARREFETQYTPERNLQQLTAIYSRVVERVAAAA